MVEKIVIPLFATFIGAFFAFRYQFAIEKRKEKRAVVQQLVMYRNVAADELDWIRHMNLIDIVFHNNERVRQLYEKFLDYVNDDAKFKSGKHVNIYYEMVYLMCQDCGYTQITESDVKKNIYSPKALDEHYRRTGHNSFAFHQGALTAENAVLLDEISQWGLA